MAKVWQDKEISKKTIIIMYAIPITIIILSVIPIIFGIIHNIPLYALEVYPVLILSLIVIAFYIYIEKQKLLSVTNDGLVIKWMLETGSETVLIKWDKIRRISIFNSGSITSYFKWKKVKYDLSFAYIIKSFMSSKMLAIHTKENKVFFIDVHDEKGFMYAMGDVSKSNPIVTELPVLRY